MVAEASRVVLKLTKDSCLLGAVAAAAAHCAASAHLDAEEEADWVAATEEACRETLALLPDPSATLEVTIEDFPDRLELTLQAEGAAFPAAGLESFAFPEEKGQGGLSGLRLLARVDRVQFRSEQGRSLMTLIKYIRPFEAQGTPRAEKI